MIETQTTGTRDGQHANRPTEVTQSPTVLYRSDESLRVASSVLASQGGGRALRAKPFCGERGPVELRAVNAIDCPQRTGDAIAILF